MNAEEIRRLRTELGLDVTELAAELGLDPATVRAWERGEQFVTRRHLKMLEALRERRASSRQAPGTMLERLNDPRFWQVCRKLLRHDNLFEQVVELATPYPDPALPDEKK